MEEDVVKVHLPASAVTWITAPALSTVIKMMKGFIFIVIAVSWFSALTPAMAQTFHDYPCTVDCSGHEAGYEWAEKQGIEYESDCSGNSNSFIEGCNAYVEEIQEDFDYEADDEGNE
jgi:hypothetical protein